MKKICIITGTRAEYGILSNLMHLINADESLILQIIATNMHLSPEFGLTYKEIEGDGFVIDKKVQMLLSSDTPNATVKSIGLATVGFADAFEDLKPDLLILLGDRFEMLAAATAALPYKIPIAHFHGGEITEGAYDESIRHAITKLSHIHFTSTEEYRNRVIQLGELPHHVFNIGALGVENITKTKILPLNKLEKEIDFKLSDKCFLVTFHPVTLENQTAKEQFTNLLLALDRFNDYKIIFTLPNSDTDGRIIIDLINLYVEQNTERVISYKSLGLLKYFSVLSYISGVIGNSSSGIIEVPNFGIPSLNIGNRQKGRICAESVINCGTSVKEIENGIKRLTSFVLEKDKIKNPYYKKNSAENALIIIKEANLNNLISKPFYNLDI